jgi:DNA-binding transcriptional LysR family regulator
VDLKQLEHFVALAEERHFTRASRRLNLVQSGLLASIRSLEEDLGGLLFIRNARCVDLSPAGEVLFDEARRVLAARARRPPCGDAGPCACAGQAQHRCDSQSRAVR